MLRSQLLGIAGALVVATGVFLPALSFHIGNASLWDAHRLAACMLLGCVGLAVYSCGARMHRWLVIAAFAAATVTIVRLFTLVLHINSQSAENSEFAKREPGWAGLVAFGIPTVHWLGWLVILIGAALILVAGLMNKSEQSFDATLNEPASHGPDDKQVHDA